MSMHTVWTAIRNSLKAIRNGEFLLRVRADKLYMHILYLFLLMWLSIMLSLQVDKTLTTAGANKAAIEELRIHHAEREAALVKLRSASGMEERLEKMGSKATLPSEPPTIIKKR
ncbi:MAG: hypothetical protein IJ651_04035 [Bacteroidales bacterium]|nr:hypothetical protein [Bacteroidales bacterium]